MEIFMKKLRKHATMAFLLVSVATIAPVYANSASGQKVKREETATEIKKAETTWCARAGAAAPVLAIVGIFVVACGYANRVDSLMRADEALMQELKEDRERRGEFLLGLCKKFNLSVASLSGESACAILDGAVGVLGGVGIIACLVVLMQLERKQKNKAEIVPVNSNSAQDQEKVKQQQAAIS